MTITHTSLAQSWAEYVIPLSWDGPLCLVAHYLNSAPVKSGLLGVSVLLTENLLNL